MAIAKNRVHIICGFCGNNEMFKYSVSIEQDDDTEEDYFNVILICENCSSLTGLDELMDEDKPK
jgi:hypothetical protein